MPADRELNETLVFEVAFPSQAASLCARLRRRWHVNEYDCGELVLVAAELTASGDDLGVMLRAVEAWASESDVRLLRFHLDGRAYVLEARLGLVKPAA